MNKCLRYVLVGGLLMSIAGLPGVVLARQDDGGGSAPAGGPGGRGGRGGRGRGNWQGGPPPNGFAPDGKHHGPPGGASTSGAAPTKGAPVAKAGSGRVSGEQFYIIASVDPAKQEVLLKLPTEVTLLMKVGDSTQYIDETGQPLKLSDLHAGDTAWVASSAGGGEPTATHIRKGEMTVAELHAHYLDYAPIN